MCLTLSLFGSPNEGVMEVWGQDHDLAYIPKIEKTKTLPLSRKIPRTMIRFFQNYISPIDGPRSSYVPTSSQYALQAIEKYGFFKGVVVGCDRLLRENGQHWVYEVKDFEGLERKVDPVR